MINKILFSMAALLMTLSLTACVNENDIAINEVSTQSPTSVDGSKEMTVTGSYHFLANEAPAESSYEVCFEPAQLETVNDGDLFCFRNKEEAVSILGLDTAMLDNCADVSVIATVKIRSLTTDPIPGKADECMKDGSCPVNTAELVELIEDDQNFMCNNNAENTIMKNRKV